jgi:hypothetical protein
VSRTVNPRDRNTMIFHVVCVDGECNWVAKNAAASELISEEGYSSYTPSDGLICFDAADFPGMRFTIIIDDPSEDDDGT